jgi:small GTP-binding protein
MIAEHRGTPVRLQMWDTAGQEIYRSITRMYFRNSHVVVVCYDITSRDSFVSLDDWIALVSEEVGTARVIIVATKKDLSEGPDAVRPAVTLEELEAKAASGDYPYLQTSALNRDGIPGLKDMISEAALNVLQVAGATVPIAEATERQERGSCC